MPENPSGCLFSVLCNGEWSCKLHECKCSEVVVCPESDEYEDYIRSTD